VSVAPTTAAASPGPQSASDAATTRVMANYDLFLKMLTTQLRVQNPLEPMNAEKFTEQLVQYSAVEQQIQANQKLEDMLTTMISSTALSLVNYIGKTVEAAGDITQLRSGKALWKLDAASSAADSAVTIRNSAGVVVYEGKSDLVSGENTFEWDGRLANGQQAPEGEYQISVTAKDGNEAPVAVTTRVSGVVTAVDTTGAIPYLQINGALVPMSALRRISA
jgi:flagellar basal-body rod modification protein FlgD